MSGISQFFQKVGQDIAGVFGSSNALYNKLSTDEQVAAAGISGAIAIINQNITVDAPLLIPIIQSKFPNVTLDTLTKTLTQLAATVTTAMPATLADAITAIQVHLIPKQGNDWIVAVQGLVSLGATIVSPITPVQKFIAIAEYVYQDIVTPILGLHHSTTVPAPAPVVVPLPQSAITPDPNVTQLSDAPSA